MAAAMPHSRSNAVRRSNLTPAGGASPLSLRFGHLAASKRPGNAPSADKSFLTYS